MCSYGYEGCIYNKDGCCIYGKDKINIKQARACHNDCVQDDNEAYLDEISF